MRVLGVKHVKCRALSLPSTPKAETLRVFPSLGFRAFPLDKPWVSVFAPVSTFGAEFCPMTLSFDGMKKSYFNLFSFISCEAWSDNFQTFYISKQRRQDCNGLFNKNQHTKYIHTCAHIKKQFKCITFTKAPFKMDTKI